MTDTKPTPTPPSTRSTIDVAVEPATAFAVFTDEIDCWWQQGAINFHDTTRTWEKRIEPGVGDIAATFDQQALGLRLQQTDNQLAEIGVDQHVAKFGMFVDVQVHLQPVDDIVQVTMLDAQLPQPLQPSERLGLDLVLRFGHQERTLRNRLKPCERSVTLVLRPLPLAPVAELQHVIAPVTPIAVRRDGLGPDERSVHVRFARRVADGLDPTAGEQHETAATVQSVQQMRERLPVPRAQVQEARIGSDRERLLLEPEVVRVHRRGWRRVAQIGLLGRPMLGTRPVGGNSEDS